MTTVSRRDDGGALRALRVGVHPSALVQHLGTDVVVRTPERPDHRDGNVVDLLVPPGPGEVPARLEAIRRLMTPVGVGDLHLRYELPAGALGATGDPADDGDADGDAEERARADALRAAGCRSEALHVLVLDVDGLPAVDPALPADTTVERLVGPDGDVVAGRRWYAAGVLDRYAHGDEVEQWRTWDTGWGGWHRDRLAALARIGRAEVWLASRHGMPVASVTLLDDADGLAVVEAVITHPAHRRRGIARILLTTALRSLRVAPAPDRVAVAVHPGAPAEALFTGLGFRPSADVRAWLLQDGRR